MALSEFQMVAVEQWEQLYARLLSDLAKVRLPGMGPSSQTA